MKNHIKSFIILFLIGIFAFSVKAQDNKTETVEFKVEGVCGMCKERIENASLIKGVKFTEYDVETSMLKVVYRSDKTTLDDIHKSIAKAGHATDKVKADPKAYEKLPMCCQYSNPDNPHLQDSQKGHNH